MQIDFTDDEIDELQSAVEMYLMSFSMANHPGAKRLAIIESAGKKLGMVDDDPQWQQSMVDRRK